MTMFPRPKRQCARRLSLRCLALLGCLCLLPSCASQRQLKASEATFELYVDVEPREASIFIDEMRAASGLYSHEKALVLLAGTRRIRIEHPLCHSFRTELEYIQPGETLTLKTKLIPKHF